MRVLVLYLIFLLKGKSIDISVLLKVTCLTPSNISTRLNWSLIILDSTQGLKLFVMLLTIQHSQRCYGTLSIFFQVQQGQLSTIMSAETKTV